MGCTEQVLHAAVIPDKATKEVQKKKVKLIVAASLGNFLEFFDFTVYSYFAVQIAILFFNKAPGGAMMASFAVFWIGFLARPVGSFVLGGYADRRGRKAALLATILFMAVGSAIIAFTPTYGTIGFLAPVLIIVGRLLQGFSAGGEIGAATTLLLESAKPEQRGFFISWQYVTQSMSALVGSLFGAVLSYFYPGDQMLDWAWRIPFIFSLLIIPVGLYIRSHIDETYVAHHDSKGKVMEHPIKEIAASHLRQFLLATLLVMPVTLVMYIMIFYMKTYLGLVTALSENRAYLITTGSSVILLVFSLFGGLIGDRLKRRKPFILGSLAVILAGSFLFYSNVHNPVVAFSSLAVTIAVFGMLMTLQTLLVVEAFPRQIRATALAMSYSIGVTVFGGSAQLVVTKFMELSGNNPMTPFWYLGSMLGLGMIAYSLFQEKRYD